LAVLGTRLAAATVTFIWRMEGIRLKHSLNVATAGGVAIYELLRKYRELQRPRYLDSL
jgi:tRNA G18 (ribose-2'-O)-methylase SpoU